MPNSERSLAGQRVLVTGGAGFVGSHIVDLLVDAGCSQVVVVDNMVRGRPANLASSMGSGIVELVEGDIRDHELMAGLVAGCDTVFHQAVHRKRYDAIVCMYHDQGHTPMKLLAFESGVNATIGLPIVRTSVDHGTAFDIAWQGVAFTESLDHALGWARRLAGAALPA